MSEQPEFSRRVSLSKLVHGSRDYKVEASPEQCTALCDRLRLQDLTSLTGHVRLTLSPHAPYGVDGPSINLEGTLSAQVVQTCVVSTEPIQVNIDTDFSGVFIKGAETLELYDSEDKEEFEDGPDILGEIIKDSVDSIDLGELFAQQLALELDPFPRKVGLNFEDYAIENNDKNEKMEETGRKNPFDVLKKLQKKP